MVATPHLDLPQLAVVAKDDLAKTRQQEPHSLMRQPPVAVAEQPAAHHPTTAPLHTWSLTRSVEHVEMAKAEVTAFLLAHRAAMVLEAVEQAELALTTTTPNKAAKDCAVTAAAAQE